MVKKAAKNGRHKQVVALLFNGGSLSGYVDPSSVGRNPLLDILTTQGEHKMLKIEEVKSLYFVRDLAAPFDTEHKKFLSRPKLEGLWVRLRFRDEDIVEGIVANDLLSLLDAGVQLTPPDLHGNTTRMFVPRSAILDMKVLGVVGAARRAPKASLAAGADKTTQKSLFGES
jgi:hypothetical protein